MYFLCCAFAVAGDSLQAFLDSDPKMPSASVLAKLAKRGSPAQSSRPVVVEERGVEGTSRPVASAVGTGDLHISGVVEIVATRDHGRKRCRKEDESGSSRPRHQSRKSKSLVTPSKDVVDLPKPVSRIC